jgi:hypothetical protein
VPGLPTNLAVIAVIFFQNDSVGLRLGKQGLPLVLLGDCNALRARDYPAARWATLAAKRARVHIDSPTLSGPAEGF